MKAKINSSIDTITKSLRLVYHSSKKLCFTKVAVLLLQSTLPVVSIYLLKHIVDGFKDLSSSSNIEELYYIGGLFCAIFLLMKLVTIIDEFINEVLVQKLTDYICTKIHHKAQELDISHYDSSEYYDTFHRAQQEATSKPYEIVLNGANFLRNTISLLGVLYLLIIFSWKTVVLLCLAALPSLLSKILKVKRIYSWRLEHTALYRESEYYSEILTNRQYTKDVRMYGIGDYFTAKFNKIRATIIQNIIKIFKRSIPFDLISLLSETAAFALVIYLLVDGTIAGAITVGSCVMFFEAFRRGQGFLMGMLQSVTGIYRNNLFISNLFSFFGLQSKLSVSHEKVPFPTIIKGVEFNEVSFSYPASTHKVLNNLSFTAKCGEITAIQGLNGSGKTTLMKLLCRLYDCDSGAITIDDTNINTIDLKELHKNISVLFQDFSQLNLSVKENIQLGNIEAPFNKEQFNNTLDITGVQPLINRFPKQENSYLGKHFRNGEELSMGQWQSIALSRALYKDSSILLLDEPTSWFDIEKENNFIEALRELKKDRVIIIINHYSKNSENNKVFDKVVRL